MDIGNNTELKNIILGIERNSSNSENASDEEKTKIHKKFKQVLKHLFDELGSCESEQILRHNSRTADRADALRLSIPLKVDGDGRSTNVELLFIRTTPDDKDKTASYLYEIKDSNRTYLSGFTRHDITVLTDPATESTITQAELLNRLDMFTTLADGIIEDYELKPYLMEE